VRENTSGSTNTTPAGLDPASLGRHAGALFADARGTTRLLQRWRPRICPFDVLLRHVPAGSTVLDVGCGAGLLLGLLARTGRLGRGTGFDASGDAIDMAQRMSSRLEPGLLSFERRDAGAAWPAGMFDVVALVDVLHHVPRDRQQHVVQEAIRHVAPGGRLLYKDMCRRPRWRAAANRLHDLLLARQWIHEVPLEDVRRWMEEAGMSITHTERVNRLWYGHDLLIARKSGRGSLA
jgi:2-polyprenyl-3-methyl-5-hydroxy-6-metoxy-1,4-benzoquinol methylase